jgi:hypothetical protein
MTKKIFHSLILLTVICSIYRVIPDRPMGFAPQIAMALFGGSLFVNNKRWAFFLPLMSMFISDCMYQIMYLNNMTQISGFYSGQWMNYLLFGLLTCFGFDIKINKPMSTFTGILFGPFFYFFTSNLLVWIGGGGYDRPTLIQCYIDGLPFFINSVFATIFYGTILFGGYNYITKKETQYNYE